MIKAIVAVDEKWGIGKKNDLLFRLPLDMKYFREKTLGKTVCMGYNTLLSFPEGKPLKNRKNIVLCPEDIERDDLLCVHTLGDMLNAVKNETDDVYVIGGAKHAAVLRRSSRNEGRRGRKRRSLFRKSR